jgi:hypothetical protein
MDKKKLDSLVFVEAISLTIVKRNQVLAAFGFVQLFSLIFGRVEITIIKEHTNSIFTIKDIGSIGK